MGKVDYAQKQRERSLEGKRIADMYSGKVMQASKRASKKAPDAAATIAYGLADAINHKLDEMERMARDERLAALVDAARRAEAEKAMVAKVTSVSESLDLSMKRFLKVNHDILVERTEDWGRDVATYRFINPATGDYYDCTYDHRLDHDMRSAQDARLNMMEAALDYLKRAKEAREEKPLSPYTDDAGHYTDIEGRSFLKKVPEDIYEAPEEKPKHREGHFPTHWVEEAMDRADASEKCITITMERKGVMVVATEGDDKYSSHVITWEMMEKAHVNPLPLAIEDCEKKLALLGKMKAKLKK